MNKEILEVSRHCVEDRCCSDCIYFNEEDDAITLLINCLEKFSIAIYDHRNKYHWHDLRKYPTDLPNTNCRRLCKMADGEYVMAEYYSTSKEWYPDMESYYYFGIDVIAWCEVDEYESEDDLK